ncbi:hypothetical protein QVD17_34509 [Tagetes erecta]|uniref:Uncharacterized protein n=1 Tax=Tagetes erecta TaxID=13708 RepID=A0AAD8NKG3_TARER|nr:hypothetical protein QVD17_34509 [Tagetes erecta]
MIQLTAKDVSNQPWWSFAIFLTTIAGFIPNFFSVGGWSFTQILCVFKWVYVLPMKEFHGHSVRFGCRRLSFCVKGSTPTDKGPRIVPATVVRKMAETQTVVITLVSPMITLVSYIRCMKNNTGFPRATQLV